MHGFAHITVADIPGIQLTRTQTHRSKKERIHFGIMGARVSAGREKTGDIRETRPEQRKHNDTMRVKEARHDEALAIFFAVPILVVFT